MVTAWTLCAQLLGETRAPLPPDERTPRHEQHIRNVVLQHIRSVFLKMPFRQRWAEMPMKLATIRAANAANGNAHVSHDCVAKPLVTPSYMARLK